METTLDIAAILTAITWPVTVLIILLVYLKKIPALVNGLVNRVSKLEFAGVSLELAKAKPFMAEWANSTTGLDLRHKATAMQIIDSTARTFLTQLMDDQSADYAEINLGTGAEWLTSRLFIIAIIYERMKSINCFVFVETSEVTRKRYVGWASPSQIRWALARKYPWLEQAYGHAYADYLGIDQNAQNIIVSNRGQLGNKYAPIGAGAAIELFTKFLQKVQITTIPLPNDAVEWVLIDTQTQEREHARWLTAEFIEIILGSDCHTETISALSSKSEQIQALLKIPKRFVAATSNQGRLEYLVDRSVLLEQVADRVAAQTDSIPKAE